MYVGGGWWWWCLQKPSKEKFRSIAEIEHFVGVVDVSWGWKSSMTGRQTDRQRDSEWHPIKWDFVILISFWGRNQSWKRDKVWRWQTMVRIDRISSLSDKEDKASSSGGMNTTPPISFLGEKKMKIEIEIFRLFRVLLQIYWLIRCENSTTKTVGGRKAMGH